MGRLSRLEEAAVSRYPYAFGIVLMICASAFFALMHASVRHVAADMHPFEVGFFRNLFGFLFFAPIMLRSGLRLFHTERIGLHVFRGAINGVSMLCWFYALAVLPLADATSLSLTGPLFVTLGAIFILGETVRLRRWLALGAGIVGTLVIVRPGFEEISLGAVLVLSSAVLVAGSKIAAKSLSRTDGTATIVAYMSLLMTVVTLIPAVLVWQWPTLVQFGWLILIGVLGSIGHVLVVRAYIYADVSALEPVAFSRLLFAAGIGYLAFGEVPNIWVWIGGGIIVASTTYIAHREAVAKRNDAKMGEFPA